jgi:oligopeptidase A
MQNPLLDKTDLPPFSRILPEHAEPAIDAILAENRQLVEALTLPDSKLGWNELVVPLERAEDRLDKAWSPISHMNSVVNSDALRAAYNACLAKITEYYTEQGQNEALFRAYRVLGEGDVPLTPEQRRVVDNAVKEFRLSGVDLPPEQKGRFMEISRELSELSSKFSENLLDATNGWSKLIEDEGRLAGIPGSGRDMARQAARQKELDGWLLTLEMPSYLAVMTHAEDRALRREVYQAFATRASDQGPHAGQWDNSEIMERILRLRHEQSRLLGFDNYAERSLARKMAADCDAVIRFLGDLAEKSRPQAQREYGELEAFARQQGVDRLEAWDQMYYSEKMRQARYDISQEELKPYFPETRVIPGLFAVVQRLFGVEIGECDELDGWHPDVRLFEIRDPDGSLRGRFYLDLYARPKKRGGAWMDSYCGRFRDGERLQVPVAYLVCNASPPVDGKPALFTHDEVTTLFHEFGHGIHHMLTRIDYPEISGINGVEWDAVELPSQFLENWCWEPEALNLISGHWQSGEPLPAELLDKMLAARNFQAAMKTVRQLEFALFDFRLHREYDPELGGRIQEILDQVRDQVAVIRPPAFNRFAHGFSHIFAGGYAAGYYSYKWAEVLSADAYSLFEEQGIFSEETGRAFLNNILERGGSQDAMALFKAFRGREPSIEALLRHNGIANPA